MMAASRLSHPIRLLDITSKLPQKAWSPNVWKTRYVLNYKKLPYETTWVEFPDVSTACQEIGAPPTSIGRDGTPRYTLPAIQVPGEPSIGISDSWNIAEYIENTFPSEIPEQSLIPPGTRVLQMAFLTAFRNQLSALWPLAISQEVGIFTPRSEEYFRRSRMQIFKLKKLEDMVPTEEDRRAKWKQLEKDLGVVDSWIPKGDTFVMGGINPTYPDFVIAGILVWCRTIWKKDSEEWRNISTWHGGRWGRLVQVLKDYEQVH